MRNILAALFLTIAASQTVWTILDFQGINQYGLNGWPYEINLSLGGCLAFLFFVLSLIIIDKKSSRIRTLAFTLPFWTAVYFWFMRYPAEPYNDYGEENFGLMVLNICYVGIIMVVIFCLDKFLLNRKNKHN